MLTTFAEEIVAVRGLGIQQSTTRGIRITLPALPLLSLFFSPSAPRPPSSSPGSDAPTKARPAPTLTPPPPLTLTFPLSTSTSFVPLTSIGDVIVNEAVYGWKIIYYLAIVTWIGGSAQGGGSDAPPSDAKVVVGFPELLPRLAEVRAVWEGVRATLFDETGEGESDEDGLGNG